MDSFEVICAAVASCVVCAPSAALSTDDLFVWDAAAMASRTVTTPAFEVRLHTVVFFHANYADIEGKRLVVEENKREERRFEL